MLTLMLLIVAMACLSTIGSGDPLPPSFVWTAGLDFLQTGLPAGTSESATATDAGMTVEGSCLNRGVDCSAAFSWDRPFTVTSPGTFELFGSATEYVAADNCFSAYCTPAAVVSASFTAGGYVGLSDSGSAIDADGTCAVLGCIVSLNLSDTDSWFLTLGMGEYALSESYLGYAEASGDIYSDF
jgi:hypothetical protein